MKDKRPKACICAEMGINNEKEPVEIRDSHGDGVGSDGRRRPAGRFCRRK